MSVKLQATDFFIFFYSSPGLGAAVAVNLVAVFTLYIYLHIPEWTTYVIHPVIFYRKLYNGGHCSTIWQGKTHDLYGNIYINNIQNAVVILMSNHSDNISFWCWIHYKVFDKKIPGCMMYVVHPVYLKQSGIYHDEGLSC
jgi:hypothetical protein